MLNPIIDSNLRTNIFIENKAKNSREIFIVRFFMNSSFLFVFAYILSYNVVVVKKEGVFMIHTLKLVLFITFLVLILLHDKIFEKNKKIWKIVFAILAAAAALSFMY